MNDKFRQFLENVVPYLVVGMTIAFMIALFIFFSYILLWGIVIAAILGAITWVKNQLSSNKNQDGKSSKKGRTIEHDDS